MIIDLSDKEIECLIRSLVLSYSDREEDIDQKDIRIGNETRQFLIGKLISKNYETYEPFYNAAKKEQYSFREPINKKLFLGAGYFSVVQKNNLHKRLEFAASELGGMQQNGGMGTEFDQKMDSECSENIRLVMKDIIKAFGISAEDLK